MMLAEGFCWALTLKICFQSDEDRKTFLSRLSQVGECLREKSDS